MPKCQLCGFNPEEVDNDGDVCDGCQYDIMVEAIMETGFLYRDEPDNEALRDEFFEALNMYEAWYVGDGSVDFKVEVPHEGS